MKNLKLFLLSVITPLLCIGASFCSAFELSQDFINYLDSVSLSSGSLNNVGNTVLYNDPNSIQNDYKSRCVVFSGFSRSSDFSRQVAFVSNMNNGCGNSCNLYGLSSDYSLICISGRRPYFAIRQYSSSASDGFFADKYWVVDGGDLLNREFVPDCSQDSNYLQCLDTVNTLNGEIGTLSGNLATCNSDLNSCLNNGADCDTLYGVCVENLSGCNADKLSLNNNIDSLTLQLQNCLGQSCEGSGDIGSGTYFNQYSLYRTDDETDYSTPITNNLFLPLGYKGKINEDNILSIAKINTLETAYQFSETDKPVVINSMGFVMLFFLGTGLLIVVIMYLRRFISKK